MIAHKYGKLWRILNHLSEHVTDLTLNETKTLQALIDQPLPIAGITKQGRSVSLCAIKKLESHGQCNWATTTERKSK